MTQLRELIELNELIEFNALHILIVMISINMFINNSWDNVINFILYIWSFEPFGFWVFILHIVLAVIILLNIKFELGIYANAKLNL